MNEWQPIETAPEGEPILVTDGAYIAEVWRRKTRFLTTTDSYEFDDATHWMPTPTPPVSIDRLQARIGELESKLLAAEARSVALESVIVTYQLAAVAPQDRNR